MIKRTYTRYAVSFAFLTTMLILLLFQSINSGSVHLSAEEMGKILADQTGDSTVYHVVWDTRFSRIPAVIVLGGALSVPGFLFRAFFANLITSPFMLGVSSSAELVVSLLMIFTLGKGMSVNSATVILAAFADTMISMGFILLISSEVKKISMPVICGVMIGYIYSAITDFAVTFADDTNIVNLHDWFMGGSSGMSQENIRVTTGVVLLSLFLAFLMAKPISAYQLEKVYAQNIGVDILGFRVALILISSVLSVYATAFTDPISFIKIVVSHLVKSLSKTARPVIVTPGCFLGRVIFCLFRDLVARIVFTPTELSINSVTAVLGMPIVIYMIVRDRKGMQQGGDIR